MNKNIDTKGNNEVKDGIDTVEELDALKVEANQEIEQEVDTDIEEETNIDIQLSELGQYDNAGNFHVREDIQGEDENGKYINVRGHRYYENVMNGLGYSIARDSISDTDQIYLGPINEGAPEGNGIKYTQSYSYIGSWNRSIPANGKLTKFNEDGTIKSVYNGAVDAKFNPKGNGTCEYFPSGIIYEGRWENGVRNGKGKCTYSNGAIYEGEWKNGNREGHGIYTYSSGKTVELKWSNNRFMEGEGVITRPTGEHYEGYILIDDDGEPKPFHKIYQKYIKKHQALGNTEFLNKNMEGKFTLRNSYHEYRLTNGSISEKTNSFITMYGDKKPDENRSEERGEILYIVNYTSESHIEYEVTSWKGRSVKRIFDGTKYVFKDDEGQTIISIPASSGFGEKEALHSGNLINGTRYFNETAHGNRAYRFDDENLYATTMRTINHHEGIISEANGTKLIKNVKKHFGGINAETLAKGLNNAKWIK